MLHSYIRKVSIMKSRIAIFALALLVVPMIAGAQGGIPITPGPLPDETNLFAIIQRIINWAFALLLVLAVAFIIWAAFLYLTSGGNEEKTGAAKKYIIAAVIAIVIAALARVVVFIVRQLLGVV